MNRNLPIDNLYNDTKVHRLSDKYQISQNHESKVTRFRHPIASRARCTLLLEGPARDQWEPGFHLGWYARAAVRCIYRYATVYCFTEHLQYDGRRDRRYVCLLIWFPDVRNIMYDSERRSASIIAFMAAHTPEANYFTALQWPHLIALPLRSRKVWRTSPNDCRV